MQRRCELNDPATKPADSNLSLLLIKRSALRADIGRQRRDFPPHAPRQNQPVVLGPERRPQSQIAAVISKTIFYPLSQPGASRNGIEYGQEYPITA